MDVAGASKLLDTKLEFGTQTFARAGGNAGITTHRRAGDAGPRGVLLEVFGPIADGAKGRRVAIASTTARAARSLAALRVPGGGGGSRRAADVGLLPGLAGGEYCHTPLVRTACARARRWE